MSSIIANLSSGQRRLMNVLYDTGTSCPGMNARTAKQRTDIDHDEVVGLAMADLVEGRTADRGELIDIPARGKFLYVGGHVLRLTNLGISWVNENPLNRLLRALEAAPRGRFDLRDASHVCDDDRVIIGVVTEGYATLHFKGDLRETKFGNNDGRYEFAHGDCFVLLSTRKIRTVLGPARPAAMATS